MPNWCYNHIEVHGGDEDGWERERFFSEREFDDTTPLQKYIPISTYHMTTEGYNDGGYEWCYENWGSKWPEKSICYLGQDPSLDFSFDSPWGPPIIGYQKISKMFPELFFLHYYQEDGMCFAGAIIYHDGSQVFSTEIGEKDWPQWDESYETDPEPYHDKLGEMADEIMGKANKVLKSLMHIE
jgi:hypothetical protein